MPVVLLLNEVKSWDRVNFTNVKEALSRARSRLRVFANPRRSTRYMATMLVKFHLLESGRVSRRAVSMDGGHRLVNADLGVAFPCIAAAGMQLAVIDELCVSGALSRIVNL